MMEAADFSERSTEIFHATWHHVPEASDPQYNKLEWHTWHSIHTRFCENLKFC
jgi:hypothetical protein